MGSMTEIGSRTLRVAAWALRIVGRALVGAFAGFVVVGMATVIATDYFRLFTLAGDYSFHNVVGVGSVAFALIAAVSGKTEIKRRAGATVQWTAWGGVAGVLVGAFLGFYHRFPVRSPKR